jgi:hypothetical protein
MTYLDTLKRIEELRINVETGTGNRLALLQELTRLKRSLCKFQEHKDNKESKRVNNSFDSTN